MKYVYQIRIGVRKKWQWIKRVLPKKVCVCVDMRKKGRVFGRAPIDKYVDTGKAFNAYFVYPWDKLFYRMILIRGRTATMRFNGDSKSRVIIPGLGEVIRFGKGEGKGEVKEKEGGVQ